MSLPRLSGRVRVAISALLLAALIAWTGPAELLESVRGLQWGWLVAAIAVNYLSLVVGAFNVVILTRAVLPSVASLAIAKAFLRSWAIGMVAPGKFGDLTYAHFLSSDDTNLAPGLAVGVVDKVVTFAVTSAIAVVGLALFVSTGDALWGGAFALVATAGLLVIVFSKRLRGLARTRLLGKHAKRFTGFSTHVTTLLVRRRTVLALNIVLTVVRLVLMGIAIMLSFRALGVDVALIDVIVIQAVGQLVSLIPITLAGLGVRQGTSIVLFDRISGIPAAPVLSQSLIMAVVSYINVAIVFAVLGAERRTTDPS